MILRQFLHACRKFIFLYAKRFSSFVKINKYKVILLTLFIFLILLLPRIAGFIETSLINLSSFKLLYYLILYALLFLVVYIIFVIVGKDAWLEKRQGLIIALGILIPVILFSWQQSLGEKELFLKQSSVLSEDNERNNRHLNSVVNDIKNDPYVIFWRNFYTENYKEYWSYISLNYTQECKNLYADLTLAFDGLNNMIKTRNDLLVKPGFIQMSIDKLNTDILGGASDASLILNEIIGKCQQKSINKN